MEMRDRIRTRRKELGLTLEQIGNYVGVSKSTVRKWETGDISNMRRDKIAKLSAILQLPPVDLVGAADFVFQPDEDRANSELIELYDKLDEADKATFVNYGRFLLSNDKYQK